VRARVDRRRVSFLIDVDGQDAESLRVASSIEPSSALAQALGLLSKTRLNSPHDRQRPPRSHSGDPAVAILSLPPTLAAGLAANPLLLLFIILAVGYPLGRVRIGGFSLGVAAVLFAGLGAGALHPDLELPELVHQLGLVLFVYTVGLANGATFLASFRRQGLRDLGFIVALLGVAAGLVAGVARALHMSPGLAAGLFAGSLTNTPALAAVLESLHHSPAATTAMMAEPVVAYSVSYPMGVIGMLVGIMAFQRLFHIDYRAEALRAEGNRAGGARLDSRTVKVLRGEPRRLKELIRAEGWPVVFGRLKRGTTLALIDDEQDLRAGDLVTIVGSSDQLDRVQSHLGTASAEQLELNRTEMDSRFVLVSSQSVVRRTLRELALPARYGALVTRIRRGDVEIVPRSDTVLELGDQARILAHRLDLDAVSRLLGDSYRQLRELDVLTFSLGMGLGLLVGMLPIRLPAGITVRLGLAGGPLLVALLLGARGRTGRMIWSLPHSANQTLRQLGLILFLAGVGTRAGDAFFTTIHRAEGAVLLVAGASVTALVAVATLWIGYRVLRIPMGILTGMLAAVQTQPAVLAFAEDQSGDDLPSRGYAYVYPLCMFVKIVLAQVLLAVA
jgi:putative transport protein